ncbi:MAG: hypothetical protein DDT31_00969 [Syntrophomonadaceae bacterium]|nr:hypothetical protein [Bacillota bacterium]
MDGESRIYVWISGRKIKIIQKYNSQELNKKNHRCLIIISLMGARRFNDTTYVDLIHLHKTPAK